MMNAALSQVESAKKTPETFPNKIRPSRLAFSFLLALAWGWAASAAQAGDNLIAPEAWAPRQGWMNEGSHWERFAENGRPGVRLMQTPVVLEQRIPTDGSIERVRFSAEVRLSDLTPSGRWGVPVATVQALNADGERVGERIHRFFRDQGEWTSYSAELEIPADTYTIEVMLESRAEAGTADFTDINLEVVSFRETPERETQLPAAPAAGEVEYADNATWYRDPMEKPVEQWGADIDPEAYDTTLHVSPQTRGGDGSAERPFGSIHAAVEAAKNHLRAGTPVRILLGDGVYRESHFVINAEEIGGEAADTLLVIEGGDPEAVRVRGSEIDGFQAESWTLVDAERNIYSLAWPHSELDPIPVRAWNPSREVILRIPVMIFVNGGWLKQQQLELFEQEVVSERTYTREHGGQTTEREIADHYRGFAGLDELEVGSFAVNTLGPGNEWFEEKPHGHPQSILMRLPEGLELENAQVEISHRSVGGFRFDQKNNIVLRNLTLEHLGIAGIWARDSRDILVENVNVVDNDGARHAAGVRFMHSMDITLRNVKINRNGEQGLSLHRNKFVRLENVEVNGNGWRGGLAGRGAVGTDAFVSHLYAVNSQFNGNHGFGFRQDELGEHMIFENCQFNGNLRSGGVFIEITYGPVTFRDCEIVANRGLGIHILNVHGITIEDSIIANNSGAQISIFPMLNRGKVEVPGVARFSGPQRWRTGDTDAHYDHYFIQGIVDMRVRNSLIAVTDPSLAAAKMFEGRYWGNNYHYFHDWLVNQWTGENNRYWHAAPVQSFDIGQARGRSGQYGNFASWQAVTGSDTDSEWAAPEQRFPLPPEPDIVADELPLHRQ